MHYYWQMGIVGKELDIDFVISTGDNIYPSGLKGTDDAAFDYSFTQIYTAPSLQKLWYTVLGNHDYRGDALVQLSPVLRHIDKRWICLRSYVVDAQVAEFFFLDTTPFVDKDLHFALKRSNANWKIVVGHHTIRSAGFHGNTLELQNLLLPILQENNVDLYINGHDHCLQHISSLESSPIQFLTSGGGSKAWRGVMNWWKPEEMKFYYDRQGFMSLQLIQTQLHIAFYDVFGNVLHKWTTSKHIHFSTV
ncbi:Purple acid phosphatase [Arachis hypogaea]|nr:Purple acid phosphatase [Arachis hypogaea]